MNAGELIKVLKEVPKDTEVVLWQWDFEIGESVHRQINLTCNHYNDYNRRKKQITLSIPEFSKNIDPIYLHNKEA